MLVIFKSPLGGRPTQIHKFPLAQDKQGNFGIRLGWKEDGDPVIIRMSDAELYANCMGYTADCFKSKLKRWFGY